MELTISWQVAFGKDVWTRHWRVGGHWGKWVVAEVAGWTASARASMLGSVELFWALYLLGTLVSRMDPLCTEAYARQQISTGVPVWRALPLRLRICGMQLNRGLRKVRWGSEWTWKEKKQERLVSLEAKNENFLKMRMPNVTGKSEKIQNPLNLTLQRSLVPSVRRISIEQNGEKEAGVLGVRETLRKQWRNWHS